MFGRWLASIVSVVVLALLASGPTYASSGPNGFSVQGVLNDPSGIPYTGNVVFKVQILDKSALCVLYEESHNLNLGPTNGAFSLDLGSGSSKSNKIDSTGTLNARVFRNDLNVPVSADCATGVTMAVGDPRLLRILFNVGTGETAMSPDLTLRGSPYSSIAETVQGKAPADFVQINTGRNLNQTNIETIFDGTNYADLLALVLGTSTKYVKATPTAPVAVNGQVISNVGTPSAATDAATKGYADTKLGGADATSVVGLTGGDSGKVISWDGTKWVATTPAASGGDVANGGNTVSATMSIGTNSSHDLDFETAGTNRMTITSSGKVGIGNTAPATALDVNGTIKIGTGVCGLATQGSLQFTANSVQYCSTSNTWTTLGAGAGDVLRGGNTQASGTMVVGTNDNFPLAFETNSTNRLVIAANGDIGIGTVPAHSLHMVKSASALTRLEANGDNEFDLMNYGAGAQSMLFLSGARGTKAAPTYLQSGDSVGYFAASASQSSLQSARIQFFATENWTASTGAGNMVFSTTPSGSIVATERMRIESDGRVGIGTNNPQTILDLNGSIKLGTGTCGASTQGSLQFSGGVIQYCNTSNVWTTLSAGTAGDVLRGGNTQASGTMIVGTNDAFPLAFETNDTVHLQITSGGAVGIGTIAPVTGAVLDVRGLGTSGSAMVLPRDTTANRPTGTNGMIRYNSTTGKVESFSNGGWASMNAAGSTGEVQFASSGSFASHSRLQFDSAAGSLKLKGTSTSDIGELLFRNSDTSYYLSITRSQWGPGWEYYFSDGLGVSRFGYSSNEGGLYLENDHATPTIGTAYNGINSYDMRLQTNYILMADPPNTPSGNLYLATGVASGTGTGQIYFQTTPATASGTSQSTPTTRMMITGAGDVGIGTTVPRTKLDVNGSIKLGTGNCGTNTQGSLQFSGGAIQFCNTSNAWTSLGVGTGDVAVGGNTVAATMTIGTNSSHALGFETGGATRVTIGTNGWVGVGTTATTGVLEVQGTTDDLVVGIKNTAIAGNSLLQLEGPLSTNTTSGKAFSVNVNGEAFGRAMFYTDGKYGIGGGAATRDVFLSRPAANQIKISSDAASGAADLLVMGNIGIGTTSPAAKLDVNGTIKLGTGTCAAATQGSLQFSGGNIQYCNTSNVWTTLSAGGSGDVVRGGNTQSSGTMVVGTNDNFPLAFETNGTSRVTITNGGDVGIGTIPSNKLHVATTTAANTIFQESTTGGSAFLQRSDGNSAGYTQQSIGNVGYISQQVAGSGWSSVTDGQVLGVYEWSGYQNSSFRTAAKISAESDGAPSGNQVPGRITFHTASGGSMSEAVRITSGGRVGIGVTNPVTPLQVSGSIKFGTGTCGATTQGSLQFSGGVIQYCNTSNVWTTLAAGGGSGDVVRGGNTQSSGTMVIGTNDTFPLAFEVGGTSRLFITATGIGVDTPSPSGVFDVNGQISNMGNVFLGSGGADYIAFDADSTTAGGSIEFLNGGSSIMYMPTGTDARAGRVGIGTTAPNATLEVNGAIRIANDATACSATNVGTVRFNGSSIEYCVASNWVALGTGVGDVLLGGNTTSGTMSLGTNSNFPLQLETNGSARMHIDTSGNIGIGTTAPTTGVILDVNGTGTRSAMILPRDTTANRPTGVEGMVRYNTTTKAVESFQDNNWGGIVRVVASQQSVNAQANIAAQTLITPNADGLYRFTCYIVLTQSATTSATLPNCQLNYTEPDTNQALMDSLIGQNTINTLGTLIAAQRTFYAKSGVAITWSTNGYASSGATPMRYTLRVRLEHLP